MERLGLLPGELIGLPLWRALGNAGTEQRAPCRLALVLAWDARLSAPLDWARYWRDAMTVARCPERSRPMAFYMANR